MACGNFGNQRRLSLCVAGEVIDRDDDRHAKATQVLDMAFEIDRAGFQRRQVFRAKLGLCDAAIHLERAHGRDQHGDGWREAACRHLISKNFSAPRSAPKPASVTT